MHGVRTGKLKTASYYMKEKENIGCSPTTIYCQFQLHLQNIFKQLGNVKVICNFPVCKQHLRKIKLKIFKIQRTKMFKKNNGAIVEKIRLINLCVPQLFIHKVG